MSIPEDVIDKPFHWEHWFQGKKAKHVPCLRLESFAVSQAKR